MSAVLIAAATASAGTPSSGETNNEGKARSAALPNYKPNILIILTDDQRLTGTMWALPAVKKWFGAQGTEFVNSYITTPLCCPSRATILTGKYTHNHKVTQNADDALRWLEFRETMPAYLKEAGYRTALIGKYLNPWPKGKQPPFFDRWVESEFGYYDAKFNIQGKTRRVKRYSTTFMAQKAKRYIETSAERKAPWLLYLAPVAPHAPFQPQRKYADAPVRPFPQNPATAEEDRSDKPPWVREKDSPLARSVRTYENQVRTLMSVNDMVNGVMRKLKKTGQADNTLAFFLSDHGFLWHDHWLRNKRQPYLPSVQVPFYMRWPGVVGAGVEDERIAANVDLLPTILHAARARARTELDGISLLRGAEREALFLEYIGGGPGLPSWDSILSPNSQYTRYYEPGTDDVTIYREYYDLEADPFQLLNVQGDDDPVNDLPPWRVDEYDALIDRMRTCSGQDCRI